MQGLRSRLKCLEQRFGRHRATQYVVYFRVGETEEEALRRAIEEHGGRLANKVILAPMGNPTIEEWMETFGS